jgi:N-glycosylase/DNA lyase
MIPAFRELGLIHEEYEKRSGEIRRRLEAFAAIPRDRYFYELAYCLLTPQSSAEHAEAAVTELDAGGFQNTPFDPVSVLRRPDRYVRFHNTKARRLLEVRERFPELLEQLRPGADGMRVREWIVDHITGLGWKEASHFLRNIGYRHLAILDRHILRNLRRHAVIRSYPRTLTPARYLAIEQRFLSFAEAVEIPMDELDLLFWSRETGAIRK